MGDALLVCPNLYIIYLTYTPILNDTTLHTNY